MTAQSLGHLKGKALSHFQRRKQNIAFATEVQQHRLVKQMVVDRTEKHNGPCTMHCEETAVSDMKAPKNGTKRRKFIYIRHHFIEGTVRSHYLQIRHIAVNKQKSDMLRKLILRVDFARQ